MGRVLKNEPMAISETDTERQTDDENRNRETDRQSHTARKRDRRTDINRKRRRDRHIQRDGFCHILGHTRLDSVKFAIRYKLCTTITMTVGVLEFTKVVETQNDRR